MMTKMKRIMTRAMMPTTRWESLTWKNRAYQQLQLPSLLRAHLKRNQLFPRKRKSKKLRKLSKNPLIQTRLKTPQRGKVTLAMMMMKKRVKQN